MRLVRVSLPITLLASLALHLGVAASLALSWMHGTVAPSSFQSSEPDATTLVLLRSKVTPALPFTRTVSIKSIAPIARASPSIPLASAPALSAKVSPTGLPAAALALEANPNANIRPVAPDAILCPNPAPHLDSAAAVVFILDISGSMYEPYAGSTRIGFARTNLARQIRALKEGTPFAITLYAQRACTSGPLVAANDATREAAVRFVMRDVDCGGGTNLPAGLAAAQQLHPGSLVLVTDGDLNSPAYILAARTRDILGPADHCPALAIVGIAPRESQQAERLLQGLADQLGGTYAAGQLDGDAELITSAATVIKPASSTP